MSGFSNSLSHFHSIQAIRIRYSNSSIQQLHKSLTFVSSLDLSVSEDQSIRPTIFAMLQQLIIDRLPKKFVQPIHPSTALPPPPPICSERK